MSHLHNIDFPGCLVYTASGTAAICTFTLDELSTITHIICSIVATIVAVGTFFYNRNHKKKIIELELRGKQQRSIDNDRRSDNN